MEQHLGYDENIESNPRCADNQALRNMHRPLFQKNYFRIQSNRCPELIQLENRKEV